MPPNMVYFMQCDKVCQLLAAGLLVSLGTRVSSINKANHHKTDLQDRTEILFKVALNTINPMNFEGLRYVS